MLEQARRTGVYRDLRRRHGRRGARAGRLAAIAAVGVVSTRRRAARDDRPAGRGCHPAVLLVLSFNDHTLEEPAYTARLERAPHSGGLELVASEEGEHLPGIGLRSTVYVLSRA